MADLFTVFTQWVDHVLFQLLLMKRNNMMSHNVITLELGKANVTGQDRCLPLGCLQRKPLSVQLTPKCHHKTDRLSDNQSSPVFVVGAGGWNRHSNPDLSIREQHGKNFLYIRCQWLFLLPALCPPKDSKETKKQKSLMEIIVRKQLNNLLK